MKKRTLSVLALAAVLTASAAAVSLTGCGAKSASSGAYAETTAAAEMDMAAPGSRMNAAQGAGPGGMPMAAETQAAADNGSESGALTSSTEVVTPAPASRKLIRNVDLSVETTEFDSLVSNISAAVGSLGGYIEDSSISGSSISGSPDNRRYANITARVPSDKLDGFITQVEQQGNITNRSESTQDVTLQYSDIESRKKTLTVEQERLWALLEKADTLEAVIALEQRLSEIRYQLESFESQLRTYDNQVDYSTVWISIQEVKVFTPTSPDSIATRIQKGFQRNLQGVENALINFAVWFLTSLPTLIVLAVILILVLLIVRAVGRHCRKRMEKRPPKPVKPVPADHIQKTEETPHQEEQKKDV